MTTHEFLGRFLPVTDAQGGGQAAVALGFAVELSGSSAFKLGCSCSHQGHRVYPAALQSCQQFLVKLATFWVSREALRPHAAATRVVECRQSRSIGLGTAGWGRSAVDRQSTSNARSAMVAQPRPAGSYAAVTRLSSP